MKRLQPSNFFLFSKEIQERIQKILVNIMPLFFVDKFCDCLTGLPGVEAAGDMVPMTGDSLLRKHPQSAEKEERIVAAIIHFLSSESDIHSLLHFGCVGSKITNSLSLYAENSKLSITKINAKPKATFSSWL